VFGAVVGGMTTLATIEAVPTGKNDRPESDVTLVKAVVLQNPFVEMEVRLNHFMKPVL
jgi:peptidyl-prolyl cis-trans isomerase-like 2